MEGNRGFLDSKKNSYFYMGQYHAGLTAFITMITVDCDRCGSGFVVKWYDECTGSVTFLLYISNFTEPVQKLTILQSSFKTELPDMNDFVKYCRSIRRSKNVKIRMEAKDIRGEVVFDDVGFRYEEGQEKVLSHVSLKVNAGEYVALVGTSGAGKTTLCSLIPRFMR